MRPLTHPSETTTLLVAAIQLCSRQNRDENLQRAEALMEAAVRRGAKLLALPENLPYVGGEGDKSAFAEDPESGPSTAFLSSFARKHAVAIVGGSIPLRRDGKISNTCLAFDTDGTRVARYDKIHLFDAHIDDRNSFEESRNVVAGSEAVIASLFGHRMGLSICYDLRFPELYRSLALRGSEVLFVPSAFTRETGRDHWEILLRSRAIENLCYVVAPAQSGEHGEGRVSYGRSMIIGPWGQILGQSPDGEGIIVEEIDFGKVADARKRLPALDHVKVRTIP